MICRCLLPSNYALIHKAGMSYPRDVTWAAPAALARSTSFGWFSKNYPRSPSGRPTMHKPWLFLYTKSTPGRQERYPRFPLALPARFAKKLVETNKEGPSLPRDACAPTPRRHRRGTRRFVEFSVAEQARICHNKEVPWFRGGLSCGVVVPYSPAAHLHEAWGVSRKEIGRCPETKPLPATRMEGSR